MSLSHPYPDVEANDPANRTLVVRMIAWLPMPAAAVPLVLVVALALPLVLAYYTAPGATAMTPHALWRLAMAPALIGYIVAVHPWLQHRGRLATAALRPLSRRPELVDRRDTTFGPGAWIALLLGAALAVWISYTTPITGWLRAYVFTTNVALFSLMALTIYDGLRSTRHLKRVVAAGLELDLFDRKVLAPLARVGQGVSLTFVGGICLSLIFQSVTTLYTMQALVIYSILVVVAVTLSFSSIWGIHVALVAARDRELASVRQHARRAREQLRRHLAADGSVHGEHDASALYGPLVVFGSYERQLQEASTWPFDPKIVKEVAASVVAPIAIYGVKLAIGLSG